MVTHPSIEPWQRELGHSLRTARDLWQAGFIPEEAIPAYETLLLRYPFLLPRYYAALIDKTNPCCPIRAQAIPSLDELAFSPGFFPDPLRDIAHRPVPRVTHRYPNRALFHLTPNCSMLCRFCFRKSLLHELSGELFSGDFTHAMAYFAEHPEIEEVILSGGDPFMLRDPQIEKILTSLSEVRHLKRLRFHTRVPVTFPERITENLAKALRLSRLPVVVVTHFNHPKELTPQARCACQILTHAGARLLNQSVLLRGVNDAAATLQALSEGLFEAGILPYYLHHPDRAAGTAHFDLPVSEGQSLMAMLKKRLPGYLVPRYVIDRGDADSKQPLA